MVGERACEGRGRLREKVLEGRGCVKGKRIWVRERVLVRGEGA